MLLCYYVRQEKKSYYPYVTGSFFQEGRQIESSKKPEPVPSMSGMNETAACPPSPIVDNPSTLPFLSPLPPPVSNFSCLFTQCQPLYTKCCIVLLYFSRYCTVRLKMFSLIFVCFLCIICVKSIINLFE